MKFGFPFWSSPPRQANATAKLAPPSRRRPLSPTGAGPSLAIVDPPSTSAGPCDAIFDLNQAPKIDHGVGYFFFRRFVAFFALPFAFLLFAIAALLA